MFDPRQGPLPTWGDPFSTASERCVAGIPDRFVPLAPGTPTINPDQPHPHRIAYRGWFGATPAYYLDAGTWRDTADDSPWPGHIITGDLS